MSNTPFADKVLADLNERYLAESADPQTVTLRRKDWSFVARVLRDRFTSATSHRDRRDAGRIRDEISHQRVFGSVFDRLPPRLLGVRVLAVRCEPEDVTAWWQVGYCDVSAPDERDAIWLVSVKRPTLDGAARALAQLVVDEQAMQSQCDWLEPEEVKQLVSESLQWMEVVVPGREYTDRAA